MKQVIMFAIQYRNRRGAFKSVEDLKKAPGVDVEKVEAKKDRLIFKELRD